MRAIDVNCVRRRTIEHTILLLFIVLKFFVVDLSNFVVTLCWWFPKQQYKRIPKIIISNEESLEVEMRYITWNKRRTKKLVMINKNEKKKK